LAWQIQFDAMAAKDFKLPQAEQKKLLKAIRHISELTYTPRSTKKALKESFGTIAIQNGNLEDPL